MRADAIHVLKPETPFDEADTQTAYQHTIQIWILRILLDLKVYRRVGGAFKIEADDLTKVLEIELEPGETPADTIVPAKLVIRLRELEASKQQTPCVFTRNLESLAGALGLTRAETSILEFLLISHMHTELAETVSLIGGGLTVGEVAVALAAILWLPTDEIRSALGPNSRLLNAGLIRVDPLVGPLGRKLQIFSALLDAMSLPQDQALGVLAYFVDRAPPPELSREDFADYGADYSLLSRHLQAALANRSSGCNVLIHGPPGVGKTQLVRTLCHELDAALFEITASDRDGDPLSTGARLSAYQLSQRLLARRDRTVLLFDEIEDICPPAIAPPMMGQRNSSAQKSWVNAQLERNPLPAFWLANDIARMDAAYLRRFDIVFRFRPMSTKARRALIERRCRQAGLVGGVWIRRAAESRALSPALITNLTKVMANTGLAANETEAALFERLANGVLNAMGLPQLYLKERTAELPYELGFLNADSDLADLVEGLQRNREGRLLCYGPPGTGKTAFAQHLAEALERPLLQFRASDILGPYVGMTEMRLAQAFQQAREEGAVMLLDEIDSLLRDRNSAQHTWEVTQVNELLVQMETFPGILIACTNHRSALEGAAARRFDMKISFDYMKVDQVWDLFRATLKLHKARCSPTRRAAKVRVENLRCLTPGDFKAAVRKLSLRKDGVSAPGLIAALEEEARAKAPAVKRSIGFAAEI